MKLTKKHCLSGIYLGLLCGLAATHSNAALEGYATLNGNTTGGAGGQVIYASTGTEINEAMCNRTDDDTPLIIYVDGTINHGNTRKVSGSCDTVDDAIQFKKVKNISLIGIGDRALFDEIGIHLRETSNIILRNLHIRNVKKSGSPTSNGGDAIGMESKVYNVWVDHCELEASGGESDGYDSLIDMKATTQYVTVSYNYLHDSGRGGLVGSSDSDDTNTFVTFHHNYYENIDSRTPLLRHGTAHAYNNYYRGINKSGMNPRIGGQIKAENNHFEDAKNPIGTFYTSDMGYWDISGNIFENTTWSPLDNSFPAGPNPVSTTRINIPYDYALDSSDCVRNIVVATAGSGRGMQVSAGNCQTQAQPSSSAAISSSAPSTPVTSTPSISSSAPSSIDNSSPSGINLSIGAGSDGSSKASGTSYSNVRDNNLNSYWSPSSSTGRISIKWGTNTTLRAAVIREAKGFEGNIGSWDLINHDTGALISTGYGAGTITFAPVSLQKIDFVITSSNGSPAIAEFETYATASTDNSQQSSSVATQSSSSTFVSSSAPYYSSASVASEPSQPPSSCAEQCNWYQSLFPLCDNADLGWGWENNHSCIGRTTCNDQWGDGGVVSDCQYEPSSSSQTFSSELSSSSYSQSSVSSATIVADACDALVNDPNTNWRDTSLQTDQEIVQCLASTLGKPVGFGENTTGGYNPNGGSQLIIIRNNASASVEQQIEEAIGSDHHNWIVFDKQDFSQPTDISMHRLHCDNSAVLNALDATQAQCLNHRDWCAAKGVADSQCLDTFYNDRLNDKDLPIRNPMIMSNTTIDGRGSQAYFLFNGFAIGADSSGASTHQSENVIITNMLFKGAGHTEDHGLDPDMIRSTGESHDIWIHQNTFDTTGDSAFDVKVGAYDITISFNKVKNVKRASLHGSSDSRTINEQVTTTIHNNAFVTTDDDYETLGNTLRRVPLIRRGQSHMFNNVFYGYRKDLLSVRVGGRVLFEDNMFLNNVNNSKGDDLDYYTNNLIRDFREGGLEVRESYIWLTDRFCTPYGSAGDLTASYGYTPEMLSAYSSDSRKTITANRIAAGTDLADYVFATAGKGGQPTYLSTSAPSMQDVMALTPSSCQ